jgi:carbon-monoxide dehydrogenase small subunit
VLEFVLNGEPVAVEVREDESLLELLRGRLGVRSPKDGCSPEGSCGACTVLVDGRLTRACLALAVRADGARVTTIEGVGSDAALHPIQDAFVRHGAIQCGFCTPGLIITTKALLDENPRPTDHEIQEFLSGNFCRCAGYNMILNAVRDAAGLPTGKR